MKIPKEIKQSIKKCAKHYAIANDEDRKIRDWLENNDLYNYSIMDQLIDSVEQSSNPNGFIEFIETRAELFLGNEE